LQSFTVAIAALRVAFRGQYYVKEHATSVQEAESTLLNVFVLGLLCPFNIVSEFPFLYPLFREFQEIWQGQNGQS